MTTTATHTRAEILTGIAEVLQEVAGTPAATVVPEAAFEKDLDVDSLAMVEVVVACEERFGVTIPDAELENLRTVGDAIAFIVSASIAGAGA